MRPTTRLLLALPFLLTVPPLLQACGDDAVATEPRLVTAVPGEFPPPELAVLTLRVQSDFVYHLGPPEAMPELEPVDGVRVALDLPDGTRFGEAVTDADGLARFVVLASLWPEDGTATVTAHRDDFVMHTRVGIERPEDAEPVPLTIFVSEPPRPPMVRVAGAALDRSAAHTLYASPTVPFARRFQARSSSWAVEVPAGVGFDIVATEFQVTSRSSWDYDQTFLHWARVTSGPLSEDAVLTVDFEADAVEATEVSGSFGLPARIASPLRSPVAFPYLIVSAGDSHWDGSVGFITSARQASNGTRLDYTAELVPTPNRGGSWFRYSVGNPEMGSSFAFGRGLPQGQQPALLDVPMWEGPRPFAIDEPLRWRLHDEGVPPSLVVFNGQEPRWVVELPPDATEVVLSQPPANVDLADLLGPAPLVQVFAEQVLDSEEGVFRLRALGPTAALDLGLGLDLRVSIDALTFSNGDDQATVPRVSVSSSLWEAAEAVDDGTWDEVANDGIFALVVRAGTDAPPLGPGQIVDLTATVDGQPVSPDAVSVEAGQPDAWIGLPLEAVDGELVAMLPEVVPVSFTFDDRANATYTAGDGLVWKGSFTWDAETNRLGFDDGWSGPFPQLHDDGPVSAGGHEPEGATAGDHVWGVVVDAPIAGGHQTFEYGLSRGDDAWIWLGDNGSVTVPAYSVAPVAAPGCASPAHGPIDLRLELDLSWVDASWLAIHPRIDVEGGDVSGVGVKGSHWAWQVVQLADDGLLGDAEAGDGVYTFVLSEHVGEGTDFPHAGLLSLSDEPEFVWVVEGVDYVLGDLPLTSGSRAFVDAGAPGQGACGGAATVETELGSPSDCQAVPIVRAGNHNPSVLVGEQ